jgi:uncharacterized protein (TIGR03086 family)
MTTQPDATGPGTTARALLPAAAERFGSLVHAVPSGAWQAPTPCVGWSGATLADVGDRFDGDVLGDDPVAAWDAAIAASMRSWAMAREDQKVDLSDGPTEAAEYAEQMLLDLVVHAWDLARAAALDDSTDPQHARHVLAYVEPHAAAWAAAGVFAEPVTTSRTDDAGRLIALTGRDPAWSPPS